MLDSDEIFAFSFLFWSFFVIEVYNYQSAFRIQKLPVNKPTPLFIAPVQIWSEGS